MGELMKQMTEAQLRREAKKLIASGRMPSLEELCRAVLESRMKYTLKIRRARREGK
jgi:hypothetical protein